MIEAQEDLKALIAEKVHAIAENRIEKLVRREHVQSHDIREIVAPQLEQGIDRREMALNVTQLLFDSDEAQP